MGFIATKPARDHGPSDWGGAACGNIGKTSGLQFKLQGSSLQKVSTDAATSINDALYTRKEKMYVKFERLADSSMRISISDNQRSTLGQLQVASAREYVWPADSSWETAVVPIYFYINGEMGMQVRWSEATPLST